MMSPIEPLERRVFLSGNVTAKVVNSHLYLFGDSAANAVEIRGETLDAKALMITAGDDDTTINGLLEPAFFSGFTGHVIVRLGAGNDSLHITNADLPKDLRVELEAGFDRFSSGAAIIHRGLRISGGDGNDQVLPSNLRVLRASEIFGGDGNDTIILAGDRFGQGLRIEAGAGDDLVDQFQTMIAGGLVVDSGDGNDVVNGSGAITASYDFNRGRRGWRSGFADWRRADRDEHEFIAEPRTLPAELNLGNRQGYLLSGDNRTDDLFMYVTTSIQAGLGGTHQQAYFAVFDIEFASNAVTGGFGVGGSAGDSVYLKAGASSVAPSTSLDQDGLYRLNLDMGQQAQGGSDLSVVSTIANGLTADQVSDPDNPPYRSVRRVYVHPSAVEPGFDGKIHLTVGIDSGFEATTAVYIQSIRVRLVPRNEVTG